MRAIIFVIFSFFALSLQAAVATTSVPATETATNKTTIKSEKKDIDDEITNARLRATTGAKKTLSFQSSYNYNGGSISNPFGKERPRLSPGVVGLVQVKLTGNLSAKYRMTERDNLNLGVGVGWVTPTYEGQRGQVENPYITYTRLFKLGKFQNVTAVSVIKYSAAGDIDDGLNFEPSITHTVLTSVGSSKLQVGSVVGFSREIYTVPADPKKQVSNSLGLYPFGEYNLSDKYAIRTVYRGLEFFNRVATPETYVRNTPTQSLGLGISITRDIYLYPNIQWVWADMRPEKTNVALSANISM